MRFIKNKRKFLVNKKTNLKVTDVGKIILRKNEHLTIEVSKKNNNLKNETDTLSGEIVSLDEFRDKK